jgi:transposase-like protein
MTPSATPNPYQHHRFPEESICHAVWLYFRFPLSHRDVSLRTICVKFPIEESVKIQRLIQMPPLDFNALL